MCIQTALCRSIVQIRERERASNREAAAHMRGGVDVGARTGPACSVPLRTVSRARRTYTARRFGLLRSGHYIRCRKTSVCGPCALREYRSSNDASAVDLAHIPKTIHSERWNAEIRHCALFGRLPMCTAPFERDALVVLHTLCLTRCASHAVYYRANHRDFHPFTNHKQI